MSSSSTACMIDIPARRQWNARTSLTTLEQTNKLTSRLERSSTNPCMCDIFHANMSRRWPVDATWIAEETLLSWSEDDWLSVTLKATSMKRTPFSIADGTCTLISLWMIIPSTTCVDWMAFPAISTCTWGKYLMHSSIARRISATSTSAKVISTSTLAKCEAVALLNLPRSVLANMSLHALFTRCKFSCVQQTVVDCLVIDWHIRRGRTERFKWARALATVSLSYLYCRCTDSSLHSFRSIPHNRNTNVLPLSPVSWQCVATLSVTIRMGQLQWPQNRCSAASYHQRTSRCRQHHTQAVRAETFLQNRLKAQTHSRNGGELYLVLGGHRQPCIATFQAPVVP